MVITSQWYKQREEEVKAEAIIMERLPGETKALNQAARRNSRTVPQNGAQPIQRVAGEEN